MFGTSSYTLPPPDMFLSAIPLSTLTPNGLCVTVILGVLFQGLALGKFSLIGQDMTDGMGQHEIQPPYLMCDGNF